MGEELRIFCANHTIDEVYNEMFLEIVGTVLTNVRTSISRLAEDGIEILNLVVPKPEIPEDIAHNYKQVKVQWTEQLVATQQHQEEKGRHRDPDPGAHPAGGGEEERVHHQQRDQEGGRGERRGHSQVQGAAGGGRQR